MDSERLVDESGRKRAQSYHHAIFATEPLGVDKSVFVKKSKGVREKDSRQEIQQLKPH